MPETRVLKVKMMGGFDCSCDGKSLSPVGNTGAKLSRLFIYLLYFYPAEQSRRNLLEVLYEGCEGDVSNSFKTLLLRLRRLLAAELDLPENDCILLSGGKLRLSDSIRVESDVQDFTDLFRAAMENPKEEKREDLLLKACRLYQGELLPPISTDSWVIYENAALAELYTRATNELCRLYRSHGEYEKVYECSKRALIPFPFEENWMISSIDALIALGRYRQAMTEYEAMTQVLFEEFGVLPSERLLDTLRRISDSLAASVSAPDKVNKALGEDEEIGAYYSNYPNFVSSYRILKRIAKRDNIVNSMVLITVVDREGTPLEDNQDLLKAMPILSMAISRTLRKNDMYTRFSRAQMLVMLWRTPADQVDRVMERISDAIVREGDAADCLLRYSLVDSGEPPVQEEEYPQYQGTRWHK